ncbi:outer membrane beta-barrel protein [Bradyrhizobium daqingense]|uniref:Outer membrane immunogenic protein/high affinity Mn2+ porin n=1 Tax=Bradyrhizobium daqingense TaxID=993502 RepID=A0A562LHD9_9BRAD|nr:outer membrane beta-barrel protein [Bradyrhizobium daqingense]TWI07044.1 outer membrane immunogenic protein/high affinity Mn2+ porin [Bradyrhizobium daqingense]UFS89366.1 outer membrane beta-barrel protein [Bradyrhizobium daqingense]
MTRRRSSLLPVLLALGLGALCATDAKAADIALKAPPAPPPVFSWTGFYAGVHAGYGTGDGNAASVDPSALLALFPGVNNATSTASAPFTLGVGQSGWLGGLQAGYNWQAGHMVAGVEADVSVSGIGGRASGAYALRPVFLVGDFDNYTGSVTVTQDIDYLGTLRGRLGYASNNWLLYATGGLAWAHVKASLDSSHARLTNNLLIAGFPGALDGHASASGYNLGYAVGGGGEWSFAPRWSLKAEYLYLYLGRQLSLSIPGTSMPASDIELHTLRIGLNRQFAP